MLTSRYPHWHNSFSAQHLISFDVARSEIAKTWDIFGADKHAPESEIERERESRKPNLVAFHFAIGFDQRRRRDLCDSPQLWPTN